MSAIITGTEDCKAKALDHRQRRSQRKPFTVLEASEIYAYVQSLIKEPHTENKDKLCRHFIELVKFRYGCSCHIIAPSCRNESFRFYHSKKLLSCKKTKNKVARTYHGM